MSYVLVKTNKFISCSEVQKQLNLYLSGASVCITTGNRQFDQQYSVPTMVNTADSIVVYMTTSEYDVLMRALYDLGMILDPEIRAIYMEEPYTIIE